MKTPTRLLLSLIVAFSVACSGVSDGVMLPRRDGPDFAVAFPDPSVLVTTDDVGGVQSLLSTVQLPETDAHHEQLRQVLRETDELTTDHLLLLTEAVAMPSEFTSGTRMVFTENGQTTIWRRGEGGYAPAMDELLLAGLGKLTDPGPENLGRLASRAQSKETVLLIVAQLSGSSEAQDWDDGSVADLKAILAEAVVDQVRAEVCVEGLLHAGRLNESRADAAAACMSFDDGRLVIMRADWQRRSSLPSTIWIQGVERMSFDDARVEAVQLGTAIATDLEDGDFLKLVRMASFDDGRIEIVRAMESCNLELKPAEALDVVQEASFDSGRTQILTAMLPRPFPTLSGADLVKFVELASFDAGRQGIAELLKPHTRHPIAARDLCSLMKTASFDSGRNRLVDLFEDDLRALPSADHERILKTYSFSSAQSDLRARLDW